MYVVTAFGAEPPWTASTIVVSAFFREPDHNPHPGHDAHGEAPWPIVLALTATSVGTIGLFCLPGIPLALSNMMLAG